MLLITNKKTAFHALYSCFIQSLRDAFGTVVRYLGRIENHGDILIATEDTMFLCQANNKGNVVMHSSSILIALYAQPHKCEFPKWAVP